MNKGASHCFLNPHKTKSSIQLSPLVIGFLLEVLKEIPLSHSWTSRNRYLSMSKLSTQWASLWLHPPVSECPNGKVADEMIISFCRYAIGVITTHSSSSLLIAVNDWSRWQTRQPEEQRKTFWSPGVASSPVGCPDVKFQQVLNVLWAFGTTPVVSG